MRLRIGLTAIVTGALMIAGAAYAQTPAPLAPDVAFARSIAIIRADIATGDELVQRRDWAAALRHVMFPLEEVYADIRAELRTYKTPPFDGALRSLARVVKARKVKEYPEALQKVEKALAAADAGLRTKEPNWPSFTVRAAVALLRAVPEEYEDAIVEDRIARPVSYQVARGFVREAERMIEGVAAELDTRNAEALRGVRETFAQLKPAFAGVNAPKQPVLDVAAIRDRVRRIEADAAKF